VKRFKYWGDPLFLSSCALYGLNRWGLKPHVHSVLLHSWFNDALLIPCALPPLLRLHRFLGLRSHDLWPTAREVLCHLAGWSLLFEGLGPYIMPGATRDFGDVLAYAVGAAAASFWWSRQQTKNQIRP
jgi:hypothetical protein